MPNHFVIRSKPDGQFLPGKHLTGVVNGRPVLNFWRDKAMVFDFPAQAREVLGTVREPERASLAVEPA